MYTEIACNVLCSVQLLLVGQNDIYDCQRWIITINSVVS